MSSIATNLAIMPSPRYLRLGLSRSIYRDGHEKEIILLVEFPADYQLPEGHLAPSVAFEAASDALDRLLPGNPYTTTDVFQNEAAQTVVPLEFPKWTTPEGITVHWLNASDHGVQPEEGTRIR